ncbi:MAG TPA: LuxR C-terminal-related transcriptional regulator, partial [Spirochaetia bacterium]|nr:LuxR C-terminal-related transcriptional regulator [Spirochaetia bacterium]
QLAMDALSDGDSPLTGRERDVLEAVGRGESIAATARRLFLSEGTVRNYLSMAIQKVGAANRIEAWKTARDKGWLA